MKSTAAASSPEPMRAGNLADAQHRDTKTNPRRTSAARQSDTQTSVIRPFIGLPAPAGDRPLEIAGARGHPHEKPVNDSKGLTCKVSEGAIFFVASAGPGGRTSGGPDAKPPAARGTEPLPRDCLPTRSAIGRPGDATLAARNARPARAAMRQRQSSYRRPFRVRQVWACGNFPLHATSP